MNSLPIFGPDGRIALIAAALCRAVAACSGKGAMDAALIVLVWRRIRRAEVLLQALAERVRLGRVRTGCVRKAVAGPVVRAVPTDVAERLPRRFGWLVGLVGYQAAGHASQLAAVLAEPEMVALLRDVPQALRIVRPLCRMLAIRLPVDAAIADAAGIDGAVASVGSVGGSAGPEYRQDAPEDGWAWQPGVLKGQCLKPG